MTRPVLTPLGAARHALGLPPPADLPPFPDDLVAIARSADLGEERLHLAWELARLASADHEEHRALCVLGLLIFDAIAQGSSRLPLARVEERARALGLSPSDAARASARARSLGELPIAGPIESGRPWVIEDGAIVPQRLAALERRLAARLSSRLAQGRDLRPFDRALEAVIADPALGARGAITLTEEQVRAVRAALRGPITVISGGPGTGKTSIVVSILRALARSEPEATIALAAPTGKAADRVAQSIARGLDGCRDPIDVALAARLPEARTLHRLLGFSPSEERFRHHEGSPLAERVVIVDEASMIDLAMMEQLASALRPDAILVLLGDADQLPSVEPGAVLADLVRSETSSITVARLHHSHRMDATDPAGAHVLAIARRVNAGAEIGIGVRTGASIARAGRLDAGASIARPDRLEAEASIARADRLDAEASIARADRFDIEGVALAEVRDPAARERALAWWWEHRARLDPGATEPRYDVQRDAGALRAIFDRLESARLLCVTRGRATGAGAINEWMGARAARERRAGLAPGALVIGEPVIVMRNDYERGLFNGDQGLVLWTGEASGPSLVVRRATDRFVAYPLESVRVIVERAYAVTVHKAQGSEHDAIALVLPDEDLPRLWTREILYTAITRARRSVLLLGAPELLARAIARPASRDTGLSRLLRSVPATPGA